VRLVCHRPVSVVPVCHVLVELAHRASELRLQAQTQKKHPVDQYVTMFECGVACLTRSHLSVQCAPGNSLLYSKACKFGALAVHSEIQQSVARRRITFMKNKALWKTELSCYGSPSMLPWVRELQTAGD
jgi:hypothetical protein